MDIVTKAPLPRADLATFLPTPRAIKAFEAVQQDAVNMNDAISNARFLTLEPEPSLGAERIFTPIAGDLVGTDEGANSPYTLGLASTAVGAGSYGDSSHFVTIAVDAKGRITSASQQAAVTDNVSEGSVNLYFTQPRARTSISGIGGISYNSGTGAVSLDTADTRNVDHSAVAINAGTGLTGGGNITATRTLAIATTGVTAGTYALPTSITVDATGRITAIS